MYVISVSADVIADDELFRGRHVHIVAGLELTVAHVVFLHVHECSVMIRFAIAVAISADVQILRVFLPLMEILYSLLMRTKSCMT